MVGVTGIIQHLPFYLTWTSCNNYSLTEALKFSLTESLMTFEISFCLN